MNEQEAKHVIEKNNSDCYTALDESPMFKLSLSSKELFHSNFLEWLSTVKMELFKKLILNMTGVERGEETKDWTWNLEWEVKREYNNFDLCIVEGNSKGDVEEGKDLSQEIELLSDRDGNEHTEEVQGGRILFVLENKVKSIPYVDQLKKYSSEAEELNRKFYYKEAEKEVDLAEKARDENSTIMYMEKGNPKVWYMREKGRGRNVNKKWYRWDKGKKNWESLEYRNILNKELVDFSPKEYYSAYEGKEKKGNKKIRYVLLSLAKDFPNMPEENQPWIIKDPKTKLEVCWEIVPYLQYVVFVKELFLKGKKNNDLKHLIIKNYCKFVSNLSRLADDWKNKYQNEDEEFLHFEWDDIKGNGKYVRKFKKDFIAARDHRIHDLYHKLKYSYLCKKLYDEVKNIVNNKINNENVFPSNQGGLFKKEGSSDDKKIYVNYTYLHGEPLLEINIYPGFSNNDDGYEICYAIEVQGGVYEHGLQVRKWSKGKTVNVTAADVWKELINDMFRTDTEKKFPNAAKWMRLPCLKDEVTGWYKQKCKGLDIIVLPERKNPADDIPMAVENKGKVVETKVGYNKYDMNGTTYIYQSRRIEDKATIKDVCDLMIEDVRKVLEFI